MTNQYEHDWQIPKDEKPGMYDCAYECTICKKYTMHSVDGPSLPKFGCIKPVEEESVTSKVIEAQAKRISELKEMLRRLVEASYGNEIETADALVGARDEIRTLLKKDDGQIKFR